MNASTFSSPLETVQVISIFSYMNALSDILFAENLLKETDQHKPIPVINALHHYLLDKNDKSNLDLNERKLHLSRKIINGTDLFGGKKDEIPDSHFVNTLFNHIIDSLVFDRFGNVYGFIVEIIRHSEKDSVRYLLQRFKKSLRNLKFQNEHGEESQLESVAVNTIFQEMIEPLFPQPKSHSTKVTSTDYSYAQAGKMFLRSGAEDTGLTFQEYVEVAHTVEQLVLARKLDESALKIFALPALVNYMYKEKRSLQSEDTGSILNSPEHWRKAFKNLFSQLNNAFHEIQKTQEKDYRFQFYLALSSIKNRTTLARETIESDCPPLTDSEMEEEVDKYKNNQSYSCKNGNKAATLNDLNEDFQYLISNITRSYYNYEKESCREAFGEELIASIDEKSVVITKGLVHHYNYGFLVGLGALSIQFVRPSDDLFELYFPENNTYVYVALVRKDYTVTLIREDENPTVFRQKLGLHIHEKFRDNYFPISMKRGNEKFEQFLTKIAEERSKRFGDNLKTTEYDQTRKEWWKDFGFSLIPFYSCVKGIREGNEIEAEFSCPLDVLFFIPLFGEVGSIAAKMTTAATKSMVELSETTLRTVTLRMSLSKVLRNIGKALIVEMAEFSGLFTKQMFHDLGVAFLRFIDPGFELFFQIGKGGLGMMKKMIIRVERKHLISFGSVKAMLERTQRAIIDFPRKIGKLYGKDVYVNSLMKKDSGYGYKFIPLKDGKVAEIRTVYPTKEEVPLVTRGTSEAGKIYDKVDVETEKIIGDDFLVEEEGFVVSEEKSFEMNIIEDRGDDSVEGGNVISTVVQTLMSKKKMLKEAIDFAVKKKKLTEVEIRKELSKYIFPATEKTEMNFVQDWINSPDLKIPSWAEEFKIQEPDLFFYLKYKEVLEKPDLTIKEATRRIEALYPVGSHHQLYEELQIEKVLKDYIEKKAYKQANFEDYYALRWYGGSGYKKMAGDCDEVRRMKNAIYRLAIRQSEDPSEKYATKLFRGEGRVTESIEKELYPGREELELYRFTSTSTDIKTAEHYSEVDNPLFTTVLYEINFDESYLRSRVEHLFALEEHETILLPGTKFHIDKITRGMTKKHFGLQKYIKVEMSHINTPHSGRQNSIMNEIKKLMETDTVFYAHK